MAVATRRGRTLRAGNSGPAAGLVAQVALLVVLAATVGLGTAGWVVGIASAVTMAAVLAGALARAPGTRLEPASWVTLTRATLAVGVAALVADSFTRDTPVALLVTLSAVALALDAVDGWVARRTGTATALGARFDGEVDAFLILALSVYVAPEYGAWVLAIGAARYLFGAGELLVPWMRAQLPPRRWRKVVAAAQGIVLTVAAAGVLPRTLTQLLLAVALVALAVSVGECTWWLSRRRPASARAATAITIGALVIVWGALVMPNYPPRLTPGTFAVVPLELLVVVAAAVLLPAAPRRVLALVAGVMLSVGLLLKVLDLGFFTAFDRPFDAIYDWGYAGIGVETLRDSVGAARADVVMAVVAVLAIGLLVLPVLALGRVTRVAAAHRTRVLQVTAALGAVWAVLYAAGAPAASTSATAFGVHELHAVRLSLEDHDILARQIARDRFRATPADRLLTGLRGKDVLLLFVESYGRVAVQGSSFSGRVDTVLDRGTTALQTSGISARSAFLTSPTFGGISWLAHSTLQSGVWINSRRRYDQLVRSRRLTLTRAFRRAGWRTVATVPQDKRDWRVGSTFYDYDRVYDRRTLGYRGPGFGLPAMPDQYVLRALQRLELARRHRPPVFSEVDLISSHEPWSRIPRLIQWNDVGDGSVFDHVPVQSIPASAAGGDHTQAAYGRSIEYTMSTIVSFLQRYGGKNLVVVLLGDHQPATTVSGQGASHDVPISIVARDPKVLARIAPWGWQDGLRPAPDAPVWQMSAFRDRFLSAFGSR